MRRLLLTLALSLSAAAWSQSQDHLSAALRFLPGSTAYAYYTDWSLVREDTREVWPAEPAVGDDAFVRALAARHSPPTGTATANQGQVWLVQEQWGWSLLDVAWELETSERLAVVAFESGFDPSAMLALLATRGYETAVHEGQEVHSHPADPSQSWLRPPFILYQNLSYLEDERVLLLATRPEVIAAALDVRAGRAQGWMSGEVAEAVLDGVSGAHGAVLVDEASACRGLEPNGSLLSYDVAALAYRRQDDTALGRVAIVYPDQASAEADLAQRTSLAAHGADSRGRSFADGLFQVLGSGTNGSGLVLNLELSAPGRLFDLLYSYGATFLACPGS